MDTTAFNALSERLERLEREGQRLKLGAGVLAVLGLLAAGPTALRAAGAVPNLEARRFVLRDEGGRERGVLGLMPDGTARLVLRGPDGRVLADIGGDGRTFPVGP
jgi:hypothetical protein